jgi:hypothetical protein
MLDHIILTGDGDTLRGPRGINWDPDEKPVSSVAAVGIHNICEGWVDCIPISETNHALVCRHCKLRVTFPNRIDTWAKLSEYFRHFGPANSCDC